MAKPLFITAPLVAEVFPCLFSLIPLFSVPLIVENKGGVVWVSSATKGGLKE